MSIRVHKGNQYKNSWGMNEVEIVKDNYLYSTKEKLMVLLPKRTWIAIRHKGVALGLKREKSIPFKPVYNEDLGYVIGVIYGDGSASICVDSEGYLKYKTGLEVKDLEFAEAFAVALSTVLDKNPPYKTYPTQKGTYAVTATRKQFVLWVKSLSINELELLLLKYVKMAVGFIRGFFDSDGGYYSRFRWKELKADNTRKNRLLLCKKLLNYHFDIRTKVAEYVQSSQWAKNYTLWRLRVPVRYHNMFLDEIGFSIERKQKGGIWNTR